MKKKEKTFERKLKIIALGMSLIALSLIILALPVSVGVATASSYALLPDQGPTVSISVTSKPSEAEVFLDGKRVGTTPAKFHAVQGYHEIELRKEGYESVFVYPDVEPGKTVEVKEVLSPIPTGSISASSDPSGANVFLDGKSVGTTPVTFNASEGPHAISFIKEDYESYSTDTSIIPGETVVVRGVLSSTLPGNISASSDPSGAEVFLDGMSVGKTPVKFNASAGLHVILLVKEGYENYSIDASVKPGETVEAKGVLSSILLGNIYATSEPDGAGVYLDDIYVGTTPVELNVSAGDHSIRFVKEGYNTDYQSVIVEPGETVKVVGKLGWSDADVILEVFFFIIIPIIILISLLYFLFRRSKKYRLEQEKKIDQLEIELKRIAEFIDMQPRENPYVVGGAVDDPRFWIGNDNVINRVLTSISRNHFFIRGERRSGKTTLLLRISRALEMKTDPKTRFIPVYLSLQGIPPEMFFKSLYKAIVSKVNIPESDIEEPDKIGDVEDFINAMSYIIESLNNSSSIKSVIVLLLDEIELFNTYPLDLRESFRTVFMGPPGFSEHIRLIVTGTEIEVWTRSSPMNYLIELKIVALTAEEAREMILGPAKGVANFDDAAVDKIIEVTNCRPYEIQKICEQLIDTAIQKRVYRIKEEDVNELINSPEYKEGSK